MRRADRLFRIIQLLRRKKVVTAAALAQRLEVSERTIYRDIRDLVLSGTPIDGEAGVGYTLRPGYDLPPLMFDHAEVQALVLGARMVDSFGDSELAAAARSALSKVEAVLPKTVAPQLAETRLFAFGAGHGARLGATLLPVRHAVAEERKLEFSYVRADGAKSRRTVRPLATFFWGSSWTLVAWCELRTDFRSFRLDRITRLKVLDERFQPDAGRTLRDYLATWGDAAQRLLEG